MGIFLRSPQVSSTPVTGSGAPRHRARTAPFNSQRGLTASAERINLDTVQPIDRPFVEWQREAWVGYERVGEVHYGFNLLANLLSRVRIYAAAVGLANEAPADVTQKIGKERLTARLAKDAAKAMADLQRVDFASQVRTFSLNLSVAGECYLIKLKQADNSYRWVIRSVEEVQVRAGGAVLVSMRGNGKEQTLLPKDTYIARIWRPNPRYTKEPDSSMVGVADSIEELLMLQRLVRGAARSRMNAGLLFIPDGIAGAQSAVTTGEPVTEEPTDPLSALAGAPTVDPSGGFLAQLMQSMTTPIADEASAAGVVPMLATGTGDLGALIKHITFERSSDEWLVKRTESALERVLNGIDIPKEIVTGLESVKYSNAVVIDENLYKSNIEPLALAFVDALTEVYLRPVLMTQGYTEEDLANLVVWYDPSEIVTRPNSANEANEGVDRLMLSPAAWRREHGYAESDAPDEDQLALMLMHKMTTVPDQVALRLLQKALPNTLDDINLDPQPAPPPQQVVSDDPNVVQFPGNQPAKSPPDPQRVAVQQVGQK